MAAVELTNEDLEVPDGPYRSVQSQSDEVQMSQKYDPDIQLVVQVMHALEEGVPKG